MKSNFVVCQSEIDCKFRVIEEKDAPYGVCFSVSDDRETAINKGARFLGIKKESIKDW